LKPSQCVLAFDEREERVAALCESSPSMLFATYCPSEGINRSKHFDRRRHYDLAWKSTRHEQREGRVDRFGQKSNPVRCSLTSVGPGIDGIV